jgi:hypothetical protein
MPLLASAARSGSMRSTRARSGIAGDARNRRSSKPPLLKSDEKQIQLHACTTIRRRAKVQKRLYDDARMNKAG